MTWNESQWMIGNGMFASEPVDVLCGGCGEALLENVTCVAEWEVRGGLYAIDNVVHGCPTPFGKYAIVIILSAEVRALRVSVGV